MKKKENVKTKKKSEPPKPPPKKPQEDHKPDWNLNFSDLNAYKLSETEFVKLS